MTITKPINKILVCGEPLVDEFKVETATTMYPGRLVKAGTHADDIVVNTAGAYPIGWLGYEQCPKKWLPATVDTIYVILDVVPVLYGGGFCVVASLASGNNCTAIGYPLQTAAAGELGLATAITGTIASGSTTVLTSAASGALVTASGGSLPNGGMIPAISRQIIDATSSALDIVVLSLI